MTFKSLIRTLGAVGVLFLAAACDDGEDPVVPEVPAAEEIEAARR